MDQVCVVDINYGSKDEELIHVACLKMGPMPIMDICIHNLGAEGEKSRTCCRIPLALPKSPIYQGPTVGARRFAVPCP